MDKNYSFPDEDTLVKYLALLQDILIFARFRAYGCDGQLAELLDAVHNIPDLLCRWPDCNQIWIMDALQQFEAIHCNSSDRFSRILKNGPASDWQLKWLKSKETDQIDE